MVAVEDDDDSFERVEDLNHLNLPDDEDGDSSGSESELDDELKIMLLESDVTEAKCDLEMLQFDYAVLKAALGVVSFALLLACLYIFAYSDHVESCPAPPPAIEIPACPPLPPVPECPKCPQCPAIPPVPKCPSTPPAPKCPKVPECAAKPWSYESPSLLLDSYSARSQTFSRSADFSVRDDTISITGGFITGFTGAEYRSDPAIGEEIIAVGGVDVREKSAQEIYEMIYHPKSLLDKLFGLSRSHWADRGWDKSMGITVRRNPVYFNRIRDAVAEASDISFKRGVLATVISILFGYLLVRDHQRFINQSNDSRSGSVVDSSGQVPIAIGSGTANNANAAEKTFVQQLGDCAGDEPATENDQARENDEEMTANTEACRDDGKATSELIDVINQQTADKEAEEKVAEVTDLTAVINQQKVQVEDNRVELEMFADRLAELKRDCERMEKARSDLATLNSEPETKRSWLDRMLDECGIPQNGG